MKIPRGFRLEATKPLARDRSLFGRGGFVRLRLRWFGGRIPRKAQERNRHVCDNRVVLEHDESTRSMMLPLELYGTDEQAARGARALLEANIAPLQDGPVADPTLRAMNSRGGYYPAMFAIPTLCPHVSVVCFGTVDMIHHTQQFSTVLYLYWYIYM